MTAWHPCWPPQLRPGVVTNAVLGRGDYLPEIEAGALFVEPFPGDC